MDPGSRKEVFRRQTESTGTLSEVLTNLSWDREKSNT